VTLRDAIRALFADPLDRTLARSILRTDDAEAIAARVEARSAPENYLTS
jgi:hypothetical protein